MKTKKRLSDEPTYDEQKTSEILASDANKTSEEIYQERTQNVLGAAAGYATGKVAGQAALPNYVPLTGYNDPSYTNTYSDYTTDQFTPVGKYNGIFPVQGENNYSDSWHAPRTGHLHQGTDIMAGRGVPTVAVNNGTITKLGNDGGMGGNRIWITDTNGNSYYYAHLNGYQKGMKVGSKVKQGQVVGFVGDSGNAAGTGTHLHFEFHPGGITNPAANPYPLLQQWQGNKVVPEKSSPLDKLIYEAEKKYKLPTGLLNGVLTAESDKNPATPDSTAGAKGIAQFMPGTWSRAANPYRGGDPYDPRAAIPAAAQYLRENFDRPDSKSWQKALSIYNSGNPNAYLSDSGVAGYVGKIMPFIGVSYYAPDLSVFQKQEQTFTQKHSVTPQDYTLPDQVAIEQQRKKRMHPAPNVYAV